MLIKKAVYKEVPTTKRVVVTHEVHGCDECGSVIDEYPNPDNRLDLTVFRHVDDCETESHHFCSWECVLKFLPKIKTDYFVDLPMMYYDTPKGSKRSAKALIETLKNQVK